ncbi:MAG: response regulator [Chloroflexi bacterium]|nr:response regulator [Chloroflexota bacterium]
MIGKTILVVDENKATREYLSHVLKERQFNVLEAGSGKEALISAWRDLPDLVVFDPTFSDLQDLEFVQKLRQNARSAGMPIVAFSSDPAPARREACLKAGVNIYIVKSAKALSELQYALEQLLHAGKTDAETMESSHGSRESGLSIVFLSAKGGTGTSSLCANLAMTIKEQQPEARVVVVDLVLPIGSIAQIVGYEGQLNLVTAADLPSAQTNGEYFLKNLPQPELWKFQLLAGSPDPQHGNNLKVDRIGQIVDVLRVTYDFIIMDLGRSLSRISMPLIKQADLIPLIVANDQSTVKLTKKIWEYFQEQGIDAQNVYAILNRAVGLEGLTKSEAEGIIGFPIKTTLPYMGSNFSVANNFNQPIITKYPKDTATIIFKETAADMVKTARQLRARRNLS